MPNIKVIDIPDKTHFCHEIMFSEIWVTEKMYLLMKKARIVKTKYSPLFFQ